MALCSLILLDVIDQNFEAAVDAAVVEVETEAADFERFSAPFMLAGIDAGVQLLEDLIVTGEQSVVKNARVAEIDARLKNMCRYYESLFAGFERRELQIEGYGIVQFNGLANC